MRPAVNIDDEAIRIGKEEGGILRHVADVQNDAGGSGRGLRGANALEESVVRYGEAFADQFWRQTGIVQVEKDAIGMGDAGRLVGNFVAQVDCDPGVRGR